MDRGNTQELRGAAGAGILVSFEGARGMAAARRRRGAAKQLTGGGYRQEEGRPAAGVGVAGEEGTGQQPPERKRPAGLKRHTARRRPAVWQGEDRLADRDRQRRRMGGGGGGGDGGSSVVAPEDCYCLVLTALSSLASSNIARNKSIIIII